MEDNKIYHQHDDTFFFNQPFFDKIPTKFNTLVLPGLNEHLQPQ